MLLVIHKRGLLFNKRQVWLRPNLWLYPRASQTMKKMMLFFLSILVAPTGFTESFVLNNQAFNPATNYKSRIAVQWAASTKEIEESNNRLQKGSALNPNTLRVLTQIGQNNLDIPQKAEYFRVLWWSKGTKNPDFFTNWVDIESNKTYTLKKEHLIPFVLMTGTGC